MDWLLASTCLEVCMHQQEYVILLFSKRMCSLRVKHAQPIVLHMFIKSYVRMQYNVLYILYYQRLM